MKRLALSLVLLMTGFGVYSTTLASPSGFYVLVGGGEAYLPDAKLSSTTVIDSTSFSNFDWKINDNQGAAYTYTGRGAVGYYFYRDPSKSYSLGFEGGYNYFGNVNSKVSNVLTIPDSHFSFPVTSSEKTTAWSSDAEFVFTQDLVIPRTSLIFKLGAGYESMTSQITNTTVVPNQVVARQTINNQGFGVAGGLGVQVNFTQHFGLRTEIDGLKGGKNVGYAQGIAGLVFSF